MANIFIKSRKLDLGDNNQYLCFAVTSIVDSKALNFNRSKKTSFEAVKTYIKYSQKSANFVLRTKKQHIMGILNKSTIEKWILPHLTTGKRGFETTVPLVEVVRAILYRLKTGCQWRELPTKQFFLIKF